MSYVSPRDRVCVAAPGPSRSLKRTRVPNRGECICPLHPKAFNLASHTHTQKKSQAVSQRIIAARNEMKYAFETGK